MLCSRLTDNTFGRILCEWGRPSFRNQIIASGMQTVHHRGFGTVGLREITAEAGVAQGSFTNHFASKEEFGVAVLDHYFDQLRAVMAQTLEDETVSQRSV